MHPLSLLGHLVELHADVLRGAQPPDICAQQFYAARRYLGSRDRAWLADRLWPLLRGHLRARALAGRIPAELRTAALAPIPAVHATSLLHTLLLRAGAALPGDRLALPPDDLGSPAELLTALQAHQQARNAELWPAPAADWPERVAALGRWIDVDAPELLAAAARDPLQPEHAPLASGLPPWLLTALNATLNAMQSQPEGAAGELDLLAQAHALLQAAPTTLRVNTLKTLRDAMLAEPELQAAGARAGTLSPDALLLTGKLRLATSPLGRTGMLEVQDEGSQLISGAAWPLVADERVLDACAGGGGKALHLAALGRNVARIMATDVRAERLADLPPRARRDGATIHIKAPQEAELLRDLDVMLIDAPCSGSGTLRRHPHLLWQLNPERMAYYVRTQGELLARHAAQVRPGGRLLYATCSFLPEENDEQIGRFLEAHARFEALDPLDAWREWHRVRECALDPRLELGRTRHGRQLLPGLQGCDGFYIACLRRINA